MGWCCQTSSYDMAEPTSGMVLSIVKQPKRWKRMLVIPDFVLKVMKERLRK